MASPTSSQFDALIELFRDASGGAVQLDQSRIIGTSPQTFAQANPERIGISVQNQSSTATIYINTISDATSDHHSIAIGPEGTWEPPAHHSHTGVISIVSTEANTPVYMREFLK